jgi:DNA repair exonuclease SbcCD ATPase subunit
MTGLTVGLVGLAVTVVLLLSRDSAAHERSLAELREAESRHGVQDQIRMSVATRRENARRRVESLGIDADASRLRILAQQLEAADRSSSGLAAWESRRDKLRGDLEAVREELRTLLRARGTEPGPDLDESVARYRKDCATRAQLKSGAARARDVRGRLEARRLAETAAAEARTASERALAALREAATACGVTADRPEQVLADLRAWLENHSAERRAAESRALEYKELETLLARRPAATVVREMEARLARLQSMAVSVPDASAVGTIDEEHAPALLSSLEQQLRRFDNEVSTLNGAIEERARRLPSVADAEEEVAEAERELEHVQCLDKTLERTLAFLRRAEVQVHRDIATVLTDTVRPWLPLVTSGRYGDVAISASDLSVRVKDPNGQWRDAARLSHGTTEQIYLLLRVALAEHLTKKGERSPLLLDEVTVQSDRERTGQILDLLHDLSADRQVLLFTQEEDVREWARMRFADGRDRLIEIEGAAA